METLEKVIVEKVLEEYLKELNFPFLWGKETLYYLEYYQKGEEKFILCSLKRIKDFQEWIKRNFKTFENFIDILKTMKDSRKDLLINERERDEKAKEILERWEIINNYVKENGIPLPIDLRNFPKEDIGTKNLLWEILTWYLKIIKYITFSINFYNYPQLNKDFLFEGKKIYKPNKLYSIEEERGFLFNLIINLTGFPSREGIQKFSLPWKILVEKAEEDLFFFNPKNFSIVFYLS